jgi:hypothetical protein
MRKLFYIIAIAITTSMALSACTEDDIKPSTPNNNGGSGSLDPL